MSLQPKETAFAKDTYLLQFSTKYAKRITEADIKAAYKGVLNEGIFNGFSQIKSDSEESTSMVVTSKDNSYSLTVDNEGVYLNIKNPLIKKSKNFNYNWVELEKLITTIDMRIGGIIFQEIDSVSFKKHVFVLTPRESEGVAKEIFNSKYTSGAVGKAFNYSVQFMYHVDDPSLPGGHVHGYLDIYDAYISELASPTSVYKELAETLNSFVITKRYTYDDHDGNTLSKSDVYDFLKKYINKINIDIDDEVKRLNLSQNGIING